MSFKRLNDGQFVITDCAAVTSLGQDVATSFAAARAGLSRAAAIDSLSTFTAESAEFDPLVGHSIDLITRGFQSTVRLSRLLQHALAPLQHNLIQRNQEGQRLSFYLSLPSVARSLPAEEKDEDRGSDAVSSTSTGNPDQAAQEREYCDIILSNAAKWANWPFGTSVGFHTTSEYTGVAEALLYATKDLTEHNVDFAIVGGVDSLLDESTIGWLRSNDRLKDAESPMGLMPGEAGALFVVERADGQNEPTGSAAALVSDLCLGRGSRTFTSGLPPQGIGLSTAILSVSKSAIECQNGKLWAICDQNGEVVRAIEWGNALVRLIAHSDVFDNPIVWLPAVGFGDTAAASGALGVCAATQAFTRGYAPANHVVLCSSSLSRLRSAIVLSKPQ